MLKNIKPGMLLGDCFLAFVALLFALFSIGVIVSPAKYFIYNDIVRRFDDAYGQKRARASFERKLKEKGITRDKFKPQIIIRKRSRELLVLSGDIVAASYNVGVGRASHGIKLSANDEKTPEGQYSICAKDKKHRYYLFMQISYPSPDDAKRGSVQRIIKSSEEALIEKSWAENTCPPTNTALGGPVGIHGFGSESSWTTDGSISLDNADIEELYWNIATGTPVAIIP